MSSTVTTIHGTVAPGFEAVRAAFEDNFATQGNVGAVADRDAIASRSLSNPPTTAEFSWRKDWRRAEIPASGGHGNARSVAL
jgi:hypothetical protein